MTHALSLTSLSCPRRDDYVPTVVRYHRLRNVANLRLLQGDGWLRMQLHLEELLDVGMLRYSVIVLLCTGCICDSTG